MFLPAVCQPAHNWGLNPHLMKFWIRFGSISRENQSHVITSLQGFRAGGPSCDDIAVSAGNERITPHPLSPSAYCPIRGSIGARVHSKHLRSIADLPMAGRSVSLIPHAPSSTATRKHACVAFWPNGSRMSHRRGPDGQDVSTRSR